MVACQKPKNVAAGLTSKYKLCSADVYIGL